MVNFVILANSKSAALKQMTADLITSLKDADVPTMHKLNEQRIVVIETQLNVNHDGVETITYHPKVPGLFNYNEALNQVISYCLQTHSGNDWFCILNNDVIVSKTWLTEIAKALDVDPEIMSVCPNIHSPAVGIVYGYTIWKHLDGCCILFKKEVLDKIGMFDENFLFYFQDDDYLEQLRLHNIKHARVMSSSIKHLGSQTQPEDSSIAQLLFYCRDVFVKKYGVQTYLQRECEKHSR